MNLFSFVDEGSVARCRRNNKTKGGPNQDTTTKKTVKPRLRKITSILVSTCSTTYSKKGEVVQENLVYLETNRIQIANSGDTMDCLIKRDLIN